MATCAVLLVKGLEVHNFARSRYFGSGCGPPRSTTATGRGRKNRESETKNDGICHRFSNHLFFEPFGLRLFPGFGFLLVHLTHHSRGLKPSTHCKGRQVLPRSDSILS